MGENIKLIFYLIGIGILLLIALFIVLDIFNLRLNHYFFSYNQEKCDNGLYELDKKYKEIFGGEIKNTKCSRPSLFINK